MSFPMGLELLASFACTFELVFNSDSYLELFSNFSYESLTLLMVASDWTLTNFNDLQLVNVF
jgi:hypothetical protein